MLPGCLGEGQGDGGEPGYGGKGGCGASREAEKRG